MGLTIEIAPDGTRTEVGTATPPNKNMGEFLALGSKVNALGMEQALAAMPSLQLRLLQHQNTRTLTYADASSSEAGLGVALDAIVAAGFFSPQNKADFLSDWLNEAAG